MGATWSDNGGHHDGSHHHPEHHYVVDKKLRQHTVSELDPVLYSGEWWVFAHTANKLDYGCERVTINLTFDEVTGNLLSRRQCWCDGQVIKANNEILCIPDKCEPGKMKSFHVHECCMYEYKYWIHETDYDNWAIVGDPASNNVWILTRAESVECGSVKFFQEKVACYGYNPEKLCAHESAVVREEVPVVVTETIVIESPVVRV